MTSLFPNSAILRDVFGTSSPFTPRKQAAPKRSPYFARQDLYTVWSAADDVKNQAAKAADVATEKFEKASSKAQAAAGTIELFSFKYYAACTFGGLMACVSKQPGSLCVDALKLMRTGLDAYCCHAA